MNDEALLRVNGLSTVFKTDNGIVNAVNRVSFRLGRKESLGIVGESGCGKSVTFLSILGLIPVPPGKVTGGEVFFEGNEILNLPEREKRVIRGEKISMIFQDPMTSLNPYLRISTQITEGLMYHTGAGSRAATAKAVEMLGRVGIPDPAKRIRSYPHEFSGGMRQRVMIAMSLLTRPSILIADEPTTALDVTIQAQILDLIKSLQDEIDMSLVLVTHALGVVAGITDRIIVMYAGYIVEENTTDGLFAHPYHPYTYDLLRSVPRLDEARKDTLYSIKGSPPSLVDLPDACPFYPRCERTTYECTLKMPPLVNVSDTHRVACYHPFE